MTRISFGILIYRWSQEELEVLLVHPGGPYFRNKDLGAWTIPKGESLADEEPLTTARREFMEETGWPVAGPFIELTPVRQRGGKLVHAWAAQGDFDPSQLQSNTFEMEWPPRTGLLQSFPEIDRAAYFSLDVAKGKINPAQATFLDELSFILSLSNGHIDS